MYDSGNGDKLISITGEYPVVEDDNIYFSGKNITSVILNESKKLDTLWKIEVPARTDLIKAGNCLYAADSTGIYAVRLNGNASPALIWKFQSERTIDRLVASNGKLIAVTNDGTIMVFGDKPVEKIAEYHSPVPNLKTGSPKTAKIISTAGINEGYALVFGPDIDLLKVILAETSLSAVVYEKDE